jgi:hypothetical protein
LVYGKLFVKLHPNYLDYLHGKNSHDYLHGGMICMMRVDVDSFTPKLPLARALITTLIPIILQRCSK